MPTDTTDTFLRCPRCGDVLPLTAPGGRSKHPLAPLVTQCAKCLNAVYIETMLARESELFEDLRMVKIELAPDLKRCQHIVFLGDRAIAYCGVRPIQVLRRRQRILVSALPLDTCDACQTAWQRVVEAFLKRKEKSA
jgi:hypothetical protein